jgi:hypothetical protein
VTGSGLSDFVIERSAGASAVAGSSATIDSATAAVPISVSGRFVSPPLHA